MIHSNAVIEHVGNRERQLDFINEIARCGERFYFSTPAREFFIEIHTNRPIIHWLPKTACDFLLIKSGKAWAAGNYMHLLTKPALHKLMQQAQINEYQIITHRRHVYNGRIFVFIIAPPHDDATSTRRAAAARAAAGSTVTGVFTCACAMA